MEKSYIIGIDTGNRYIKTANVVMLAGIAEYSAPPEFGVNTIRYGGKYYATSHDRTTYMQDKTENDDYFVLSLFAIVYELQKRGETFGDDKITVDLGIGLPPSHVARLKKRFIEYFSRGNVMFSFNRRPIKLFIRSVNVFAQGYAGITDNFAEIKGLPKAYIIDIGGYTTDIIELRKGTVNLNCCESLEYGMIQLYNTISRSIYRKYGNTPDENQIDEFLAGQDNLSTGMSDIIKIETKKYTENLIRKLGELGIDLSLSRGIFIGGGSQRLMQYIINTGKVQNPICISDIRANAKGYEKFIKSIMQRQNGE